MPGTKNMFVLVLLCGALAAAIGGAAPAAGQEAEVTANVGYVSEYIFRGIPQKTSSASAGLDVAVGPAGFGTWAADVGDGNEVDLYGALGFEAGALSLSVGGTGYFYTGDFDDTYLEANVGAGLGPLGVAFAYGTHDVDPESVNYWFLGVSAEARGFTLTVGHFDYNDDDASSGNYAEAGYGFTVADLDVGVAWVVSDEDLSGLGRVDHTLVLGIGKTFSLR